MSNESSTESNKDFAVEYNNLVWELLVRDTRSPEENEMMVHAAHASYLHWITAGNELHRQRGVWLLARVYAELSMGPMARKFAEQCNAMTQAHADQLEEFDKAYALEAMARSHAVSNEFEDAKYYYEQLKIETALIENPNDRELVESDTQSGNWGNFEF